MKKIILTACLLAFTGTVYANEYYNDNNSEKEQTYKEYSQQQKETSVKKQNSQSEKNVKRQIKFGATNAGSSNSYYNFGGTTGVKGKF